MTARLGRGLGALIAGAQPATESGEPADTTTDTPTTDATVDSAADATTGADTSTDTSAATSAGPDSTPTSETPAVASSPGASAAPSPNGLRPVPGATFAELPLDSIVPNAKQPRTEFDEEAQAELVLSVREVGLLQPVVVRPLPAEDSGGADPAPRYELVMGERRWRAARAADLTVIPAIVRDTDDTEMLRDALLENLHRSQLNPLEEAAAYQQMLDDFGCSQDELSQRIGRSRPQISNTLRLLKLPPSVQRRVAAGVLSAGHARALLRVESGAAQERLAQRVVAEGMSVRSTEEAAALESAAPGVDATPKRAVAKAIPGGLDELTTRLEDRFDTRVKVDFGKRKGRITVEFATIDDLERIVALMDPPADQH